MSAVLTIAEAARRIAARISSIARLKSSKLSSLKLVRRM